MENEDKKNLQEKIEFKLIDLNIKQFLEMNYSDYELTSSDMKAGGKCHIGLNIKIDNKKGMIELGMLAEFFHKMNPEKFKLLSIETVHKFKIKRFVELFKENDELYDIPDGFLGHLLGIAIGGTRGMLAASIKIPEYKKIILPLVSTSELLKSVKQKMQTKKIPETLP